MTLEEPSLSCHDISPVMELHSIIGWKFHYSEIIFDDPPYLFMEVWPDFCVTACSLAVWKFTTPHHCDAASLYYRGVRTTPRTGLQPASLAAVTAYGKTTIFKEP